MIPWKTIDRTKLPEGGGELSLHRRGDEFSIRVNGLDLMNSLAHESEDALGKLACSKVANCPGPSVLVGGLGMGFTLASALNQLGPKARVVVAEWVPAVVVWNREYLAELSGHSLRDKRVIVREVDVAQILKEECGTYDVIVLDVDNGPEGMTHKENDWLYSRKGLDASFKALRSKGVLAVWSATPDKTFTRRFKEAGFEVEEVRVRSRDRHGSARHTIWIGRKPE